MDGVGEVGSRVHLGNFSSRWLEGRYMIGVPKGEAGKAGE